MTENRKENLKQLCEQVATYLERELDQIEKFVLLSVKKPPPPSSVRVMVGAAETENRRFVHRHVVPIFLSGDQDRRNALFNIILIGQLKEALSTARMIAANLWASAVAGQSEDLGYDRFFGGMRKYEDKGRPVLVLSVDFIPDTESVLAYGDRFFGEFSYTVSFDVLPEKEGEEDAAKNLR